MRLSGVHRAGIIPACAGGTGLAGIGFVVMDYL